MNKLIRVTVEDIELGVPNNESECPVARALQREFNGEPVYVDRTLTIGRLSCPTPPSVISFMEDFDRDNPVIPFEFELDMDKMMDIGPDEYYEEDDF